MKLGVMELPQRWLAAIGDQQLLVSSDGGDSWDAVGERLPFQPSGAVYCEKRHAVFAWQSTAGYQQEAVMRLDLPEHLDELVNPRIARDVVAWDGEGKTFIVCWGNKDAGTFGAQSTVARQGSTALLWHVAFANTFTNCGAIWCTSPVDPRNEVDASGCKNLVLSVKAEGADKPASLRVLLSSVVGATDKNVNSSEVELLKYCPKAYDGMWHDVAIPLADFTGADFSTKQLCALVINAHTGAKGFAFDLYVDGIGFSK